MPDLITTVLTRTIAAASDSRLAGGDSSRIGRRGLAAVAMFAVALLGAYLVLHVSKSLALLVALVLLVVVTVGAGSLSRHRSAWDRPD